MNNLAGFITTQQGMRRNFLAALFGICAALALPPLYLFPLAILGFSGFFLMLSTPSSGREAFRLGWWFGFGHFTIGLYWISIALFVDFARFGWLLPFALFGIPAVISIYTGIVSYLTWKAAKYFQGWRLVVFFACAWTITEMLRGWLFTGFPWNLIGYIWVFSDNMLQLASITGIWGLSLLTVLAFTFPALLFKRQRQDIKAVITGFALLGMIFVGGGLRLAGQEEKFIPDVNLRIVQPAIPQDMKWDDEWRYNTVHTYLNMTKSVGFDKITHVIWPETALPFIIGENSPLIGVIAQVAPAGGSVITGALRAEYQENGLVSKMWNSVQVIGSDAKLQAFYDKSHLVPFGEYVPLRSVLPIEKITPGTIDFSEGDGVKTITMPGFPSFGGLVCYEVIFPGKVVDRHNPPEVMVNVTNDAWYGNSAGPYQHFAMARVRAVEEGIPLIRAANTGISGVVDSYGRVVAETSLGKPEILDSALPYRIMTGTIYNKYGNLIIFLIICALSATIVYTRKMA